jgi:hypothetical protein
VGTYSDPIGESIAVADIALSTGLSAGAIAALVIGVSAGNFIIYNFLF